MHLTLYRKYRPAQFDDISGESHVKDTLKSAVQHQRIAHAYLFSGPRGTGKTSTARILAKAILCEQLLPNGNPCMVCGTCTAITSGSYIDVIEIDAASHRGIDEMKSLVETVAFHPTIAQKKVYIIDEVHMLSKDASNALLKTLEEPPAFVHFILATTEAHKILPTVISRCQFFVFSPLKEKEIRDRLAYVVEQEKREVPPTILDAIALAARGGMRDALTSLERILSLDTINLTEALHILGIEETTVFDTILETIRSADHAALDGALSSLEASGRNPIMLLQNFQYVVHQKFSHAMQHNHPEDMHFFARILDVLRSTIADMKYSDIPFLPLRLGFFQMSTTGSAPEKPLSSSSPAHQPRPHVTSTPHQVRPTTPAPQPAQAERVTTSFTSSSPSSDEVTLPLMKKQWMSLSLKILDQESRQLFRSSLQPLSLSEHHLTLRSTHPMTEEQKAHIEKMLSLQYPTLQKITITAENIMPEPEAPKEATVEDITRLFGGTPS